MTEQCKPCGGTGSIDGIQCGTCHGTGEVEATHTDLEIIQNRIYLKKLELIFAHQVVLQKEICEKTTPSNCVVLLPYGVSAFVPGRETTIEMKEYFTKENVIAMHDELSEVMGWLNWKTWKTSRKEVNVEELKFEIIDLLHFWVNLCLIWEMTPDDVYNYYIAKKEKNIQRQNTGY